MSRTSSTWSFRARRLPTCSAVLVLAGLTCFAPAAHAGTPDPSVVFRIEDRLLGEASGLATDPSGQLFFMHQDAGKGPVVWVLDAAGRTVGKVDVPGVRNEDWEDMARATDEAGRPALYIADTGDGYYVTGPGQGARREFAVLRLPMPAPSPDGRAAPLSADDVVRWPLVYPDGRGHNAEALMVQPDTRRLFLVDKPGPSGGPTRLWAAPSALSPDRPNVLEEVAEVPVADVTGAAFDADGSRFVVRNNLFAYLWSVPDGDLAKSLTSPPQFLALPRQPQGESIAFTSDGTGLLLASEGAQSAVWEVPLPAPPVATPQPPPDVSPAEGGGPPLVVAGAALMALAVVVLGVLAQLSRWRAAAAPGQHRDHERIPAR